MLGTVTVLVWKQLGGGIYDLYDILSGFGHCTLAVSIVSVLNKEPVEVVVGTFDNDMQVIEYYQRMVYQDSILVPYTLRGKKAKIHIAFGQHFIG